MLKTPEVTVKFLLLYSFLPCLCFKENIKQRQCCKPDVRLIVLQSMRNNYWLWQNCVHSSFFPLKRKEKCIKISVPCCTLLFPHSFCKHNMCPGLPSCGCWCWERRGEAAQEQQSIRGHTQAGRTGCASPCAGEGEMQHDLSCNKVDANNPSFGYKTAPEAHCTVGFCHGALDTEAK